MASVLVYYGTGEGQTEQVADRLADEVPKPPLPART
jgi:flavodoxin